MDRGGAGGLRRQGPRLSHRSTVNEITPCFRFCPASASRAAPIPRPARPAARRPGRRFSTCSRPRWPSRASRKKPAASCCSRRARCWSAMRRSTSRRPPCPNCWITSGVIRIPSCSRCWWRGRWRRPTAAMKAWRYGAASISAFPTLPRLSSSCCAASSASRASKPGAPRSNCTSPAAAAAHGRSCWKPRAGTKSGRASRPTPASSGCPGNTPSSRTAMSAGRSR
ncbi:Uncharacterised protein [Bordetella pertussis]|nr:Uncharacterised protein [Bordetella pertussis]CRE22618.1 Uncharacterised protein [Bordetella pertussis]